MLDVWCTRLISDAHTHTSLQVADVASAVIQMIYDPDTNPYELVG